jgi:hypothetical protein
MPRDATEIFERGQESSLRDAPRGYAERDAGESTREQK